MAPSLLIFLSLLLSGGVQAAQPNFAFYYADDVPWNELAAFDVVVVEPDHANLQWADRCTGLCIGRRSASFASLVRRFAGRSGVRRTGLTTIFYYLDKRLSVVLSGALLLLANALFTLLSIELGRLFTATALPPHYY